MEANAILNGMETLATVPTRLRRKAWAGMRNGGGGLWVSLARVPPRLFQVGGKKKRNRACASQAVASTCWVTYDLRLGGVGLTVIVRAGRRIVKPEQEKF